MKIAFIGVGNIGFPMAQNFIAKGRSIVLHDLAKEKAEPLLARSAGWAASPREAAAGADIVITSLPGPPQVRTVMEGEKGVLAGIGKGATWVEMSTTEISQLKRLADEVAKRGGSTLETPVTGGVKNAYKGKIAVFCAGDRAVFDRVRPVLADTSAEQIFLGPLGAAMTAKLITNMLCFIHEMALGEGLMLGKRAGLDLPSLVEAIQSSYGGSFVCAADSPKILDGTYNTTFAIQHACKDMRLTTDMAESLNVPLDLAKYVQGFMEGARAKYGDGADCLAVVKMLEEAARIPLRR
jgi:3-hydroxyisobutyrate dehydrogenase